MNNSQLRKLAVVLVLAVIAMEAVPAQASPFTSPYTFTFDDIKYISSSSQYDTSFPEQEGSNYISAGYYQVVQTSNGTQWPTGTGTPTNINKYPGNGGNLGWVYVENDPQGNLNDLLKLSIGGGNLNWNTTASGVNGQTVGAVTNTGGGSFTYQTGGLTFGTPTLFTFNSFVISGTGTTSFEALAANGTTILDQSGLITLSSTPTTIIENWTGVNEILFTSGTVTMEDVSINSPVPVPEPASLVLVGSGLLALTGLAKRKLCRQPQLPNSGSC